MEGFLGDVLNVIGTYINTYISDKSFVLKLTYLPKKSNLNTLIIVYSFEVTVGIIYAYYQTFLSKMTS